ncbi:Hydroxyproline-rich glycoprotein [Rhynchospora pubera]|uniref:Hydroxyproline-rich glycoprotein n=1 Tax=Rhynchospora pubera TaxID=906938 RepID=A0AAV8CA65_9POAL|nr:Hydroxyproline-rich glycoprotein [Rhynchospora pubera]
MAASNRAPNPNSHLLNPNPNNSFPAASSQRSTPTLFAARPLNPNPNHTIPHGILYPVSARPHPAAVQHSAAVAGVNPTAYARSVAPATGHVTSHVPQHQHRYVYAGSDVPHHVRQGLLPSFAVPRTAGPSAPPPLKGVPIASHAKAQTLSNVAQTLEYAMARERERNRDDAFIVINDRKVRLTEGEPCSLYSLCRSWVRNGAPHEIKSNYGNNERILPRPLPASFADSDEVKNDENDLEENEDAANSEDKVAVEPFTTRSLLEEHINRGKRIRARLTKQRLSRIKRYKQRLALLLPSTDLANNNVLGN